MSIIAHTGASACHRAGTTARMSTIARMGKVALVGAMVAVAVPLASSCSKDEDDPRGTYAPPADLATADIVKLVKDANAVFKAAQKVAITETGTDTEDGVVISEKEESQIDKVGKKYLHTEYIDNNLVEFTYIEADKRYDYDWDVETLDELNQNKGEKSYILKNLSADDIDDYFGDDNGDCISGLDNSYYTWTWKVEGSALVGTRTSTESSYSQTIKYEITLDADKRFKSVKCSTRTNKGKEEYIKDIAYYANPSFPNNFNKADF
jgi:hypothetical protein